MSRRFFKRGMNALIVYWGTPDYDFVLKPTWDSNFPEAMQGRYQKKTERFVGPSGKEELSEAIVYTHQETVVGGYMFLGVENDLDSAMDPTTQVNAFEIRRIEQSPSYKGDIVLYKSFLGQSS